MNIYATTTIASPEESHECVLNDIYVYVVRNNPAPLAPLLSASTREMRSTPEYMHIRLPYKATFGNSPEDMHIKYPNVRCCTQLQNTGIREPGSLNRS